MTWVEQAIQRLEELGSNQVRLMMQSGALPTQWTNVAVDWLAQKDQEEIRRNDASQSEQIEIARLASSAAERAAVAAERASKAAERQADAAERANKRANIALVIATISIMATIIGMIVSHIDSLQVHP